VAGAEIQSGATGSRSYKWLWLLIALVPAIFAVATWSPGGERTAVHGVTRFLALPVLAAELIVIAAALASGFRPMSMIMDWPRWAQATLAILVAVAFGTALFVAPPGSPTLLRTCISVAHLLFGLAARHLMRAAPTGDRFWWMMVAGLCAYAAILVAFVLSITSPNKFDWKYFGLGVVHVRQLGFYSVVGGAAAIGLAAASSTRNQWLLATAAASVMLAISFWSGTRGSLVAIAAAFALGMVVMPALRRLRALAAFASSFAFGAILSLVHLPPNKYFGLLRIAQATGGNSADEIGSGRVEMWAGTLRLALERPLFGHGESRFQFLVPEALDTYSHPHNVILQLLFQWGSVGLICFSLLAAAVGWIFLRASRTGGAYLAPAFLVVTSLLTMSLYEGTLFHPYPIMMIAIGIAYMLAAEKVLAKPIG